ncbi:MAG TPA: hypothetical protein PK695_08105 [Chitinophagaceae bacterium]|jgi:hypothetical protein|nr:hypothetical protein [Chitinophagaceae bacterium]OPZ16100.1 MAG: hypothetical protein BWZ05_02079 [Bacteroidetes bacterium ADurb.BinA245]HMW66031.1 hypothetical protein [Chitinophagaceae bacterium]HMX77287.1 hypothetical protein [Chitinophagaceae bacterium]HNA18846.1 hypothetical protein [Chitinophagaceae bacterium]
MKKFFIILFGMIAVSQTSTAQSVYAELGGPGLASLNFDTRFSKTNGGFGGRVGVGGFSIDGSGIVFVPVGLNYLISKDNRNFFEVGAGVTPVFGSGDLADGDNFSSTFGHVLLGYRMQPADGGFTFRAFISPVFGSGYFIPYYGGVSFGYKFGKSKEK